LMVTRFWLINHKMSKNLLVNYNIHIFSSSDLFTFLYVSFQWLILSIKKEKTSTTISLSLYQ
jgi:hypothetical protein